MLGYYGMSGLTARRITRLAGLADEWWNVCDFFCRRAFASSKNSKVGFIRLFGGGAGLAARQLPFTIVDSPVQWLLKSIAPTTKQRIPPRCSAASLPRFLGESAAAGLLVGGIPLHHQNGCSRRSPSIHLRRLHFQSCPV